MCIRNISLHGEYNIHVKLIMANFHIVIIIIIVHLTFYDQHNITTP